MLSPALKAGSKQGPAISSFLPRKLRVMLEEQWNGLDALVKVHKTVMFVRRVQRIRIEAETEQDAVEPQHFFEKRYYGNASAAARRNWLPAESLFHCFRSGLVSRAVCAHNNRLTAVMCRHFHFYGL